MSANAEFRRYATRIQIVTFTAHTYKMYHKLQCISISKKTDRYYGWSACAQHVVKMCAHSQQTLAHLKKTTVKYFLPPYL